MFEPAWSTPTADEDPGAYLSGSSPLVQARIADGLLDGLHLFVYPVTRGSGLRVFPANRQTTCSLARSATYDNGVLYLVYQAS
jgi:dihydrofolate reductase